MLPKVSRSFRQIELNVSWVSVVRSVSVNDKDAAPAELPFLLSLSELDHFVDSSQRLNASTQAIWALQQYGGEQQKHILLIIVNSALKCTNYIK